MNDEYVQMLLFIIRNTLDVDTVQACRQLIDHIQADSLTEIEKWLLRELYRLHTAD